MLILSLGPVDGFFSKPAKVYLLDKIKPWFGFGDPFFKVTGEFSLNYLEPVDGFHLI